MKRRSVFFRNIIAIVMCSALVFGTAACASKPPAEPTKAEEPKAEEPKTDDKKAEEPKAEEPKTEATATDYKEHVDINFSGPGGVLGFDTSGYDDFIKFYENKYNASLHYSPVAWDQWVETYRVWISSGDLPDFATWDFNYTDYNKYAQQGLLKDLPKDMSKWPNLDAMITKTGVGPALKERYDGSLYMVPRVIYNDPPVDPLIGHASLYFRKDWCEKVGFPVKNVYTVDEMLEMARKFNEHKEELGFKRAIDINRNDILNIFMSNYNLPALQRQYKGFVKDASGKYVWSPADPKTLEGLKVYQTAYKDGLLDPDFYVRTNFTENDDFASGMSGMFYLCGTGGCAEGYFDRFAAANPTLKVQDAMGMAVVRGNDGVFRDIEVVNFWTGQIFNPSIDDTKFERILDFMDYTATADGQLSMRMGLEDKDWKRNGDKYEITREKGPDGRFIPLGEMYKGSGGIFDLTVLGDGWSLIDPSLPDWLRQMPVDNFKTKASNMDVMKTDWDLYFFSGQNYDRFSLIYGDEYAKIVVQEGDLEANWKKWISDNQSMVDAVLAELNK